MNSTLYVVAVGVLALALGSPAQAELINPPTKRQVAPMNKQEKKNLDMVLAWWRVVIQNRHMDRTPPSIRPRIISSTTPTSLPGRAGFVAILQQAAQAQGTRSRQAREPARGDGR